MTDAGPFAADGTASVVRSWHEFYMLFGTAAAALVGLLFVALSFNLGALLDDHHREALAHARQTLRDFLIMLVLSLIVLQPGESLRTLGLFLIVLAAVALSLQLRAAWGRRTARRSGHVDTAPGRRRAIEVGAYAGLGGTGVLMLVSRDASAMQLLMVIMFMLLANAVNSAWFLLVEIGRSKRD